MLWASPIAVNYLDVDLPALVRLAQLYDLWHRGQAKRTDFGRMHKLEQEFGLTPLARRRLGWSVHLDQARADEAETEAVRELDRKLLDLLDPE